MVVLHSGGLSSFFRLLASVQVKRMVPMCNKDKKEALVAGGIPRSALHYGDAGWELIANCECCCVSTVNAPGSSSSSDDLLAPSFCADGDDKRKTIQAIDFYAAAIGKFVM